MDSPGLARVFIQLHTGGARKSPFFMFTATLLTNNQEYTSTGKSILEAINGFDLHFTHIKTKGTIKVTDGEKSAEMFFFLPKLRRLMHSHPLKKGLANDLKAIMH